MERKKERERETEGEKRERETEPQMDVISRGISLRQVSATGESHNPSRINSLYKRNLFH